MSPGDRLLAFVLTPGGDISFENILIYLDVFMAHTHKLMNTFTNVPCHAVAVGSDDSTLSLYCDPRLVRLLCHPPGWLNITSEQVGIRGR